MQVHTDYFDCYRTPDNQYKSLRDWRGMQVQQYIDLSGLFCLHWTHRICDEKSPGAHKLTKGTEVLTLPYNQRKGPCVLCSLTRLSAPKRKGDNNINSKTTVAARTLRSTHFCRACCVFLHRDCSYQWHRYKDPQSALVSARDDKSQPMWPTVYMNDSTTAKKANKQEGNTPAKGTQRGLGHMKARGTPLKDSQGVKDRKEKDKNKQQESEEEEEKVRLATLEKMFLQQLEHEESEKQKEQAKAEEEKKREAESEKGKKKEKKAKAEEEKKGEAEPEEGKKKEKKAKAEEEKKGEAEPEEGKKKEKKAKAEEERVREQVQTRRRTRETLNPKKSP